MAKKLSHTLVGGRTIVGTGGQGLKIGSKGRLYWKDVDEESLMPVWYGGRGIFAGVNAGIKDTIDYITINTTGNATDFGNLTDGRFNLSGCSNGSRGVFGGGYNHSDTVVVTIDYITISTTGDATELGELITDPYGPGASSEASSQPRGSENPC